MVFSRHGLAGFSGVNEDAQARLNAAGIKATCKFVPYSGPFGGGTNVCDVEGDGSVGFEYGAEQILLPNGVAILRNDMATRDKSITTGQTEQAKIQAMIASGEYQRLAAENRARLCITEPWTCAAPTPAPAPTAPAPSAQSTASSKTGNPNQSVPPRAQPGEIATKPTTPGPTTPPTTPPATGPTSSSIPGIADIGSNSFLTIAALAAVALIFLSGKK
jgi:hypothetical protein